MKKIGNVTVLRHQIGQIPDVSEFQNATIIRLHIHANSSEENSSLIKLGLISLAVLDYIELNKMNWIEVAVNFENIDAARKMFFALRDAHVSDIYIYHKGEMDYKYD